MIDFIGDVHGHADRLETLLGKLGYHHNGKHYQHSSNTVLFVGDYIDRGPKIRETLQLVRAMVDGGSAVALMGNHEYNALCFHYQREKGGHLRPHLIKNIIQHFETLRQFQNRQKEYEEYVEWFKTLPLFYETPAFRAVHACWDTVSVGELKTRLPENRLTEELIFESCTKGSPLYNAIDITLKGKELRLPKGVSFTDKDGHERRKIRMKWWEDPASQTYRQISVEKLDHLPDSPVSAIDSSFYRAAEPPVFFGHYWLKGNPMLYRDNICCLDYSVAKQGLLAAYRFDGEARLNNDKFVFV